MLDKKFGLAARAAAYVGSKSDKPLQIFCPGCDVVIGVVSKEGMIVEEDHKAPCGLACVPVRNNEKPLDGTHPNATRCPRCSYKKCPMCDTHASKISYEKLSSINIDELLKYMRREYCTRCGGVGLVPGLELYLEENK